MTEDHRLELGAGASPAADASRCDASPAWLSWLGARAALELVGELPATEVERHCLALAARYRDGASAAGAEPISAGHDSHIVAVRVPDAARLSESLSRAGIRAAALGDRIRVGFHYFNDDADVDAVLSVLDGSV